SKSWFQSTYTRIQFVYDPSVFPFTVIGIIELGSTVVDIAVKSSRGGVPFNVAEVALLIVPNCTKVIGSTLSGKVTEQYCARAFPRNITNNGVNQSMVFCVNVFIIQGF